jgi:hypothetical protein
LARKAYERELARALDELAAEFDAWRAGEIDADDLDHMIHAYHQGPSRELFGIYDNLEPALLVGRAVVIDLLPKGAIPKEVWPYIEEWIAVYRQRGQQDSA